jgi:8-oxo-dGTP pyrophosphatase MutT (NUDIX family)
MLGPTLSRVASTGYVALVRRTYDFNWFKVRWLRGYGWIFDRRPAVVVIAVAPDDRIWLARIDRAPLGRASWELPGGMIDDGEDAVAAGLRELEEECGLIASRGRVFGEPLELAPGMGTFPHHVVVASKVVPKGKRPVPQKEEGVLAARSFDRSQVRRMVKNRRICAMATLGPLVVCGWLDGLAPTARRPKTPRAAVRS